LPEAEAATKRAGKLLVAMLREELRRRVPLIRAAADAEMAWWPDAQRRFGDSDVLWSEAQRAAAYGTATAADFERMPTRTAEFAGTTAPWSGPAALPGRGSPVPPMVGTEKRPPVLMERRNSPRCRRSSATAPPPTWTVRPPGADQSRIRHGGESVGLGVRGDEEQLARIRRNETARHGRF
jgi:hypothetical protein